MNLSRRVLVKALAVFLSATLCLTACSQIKANTPGQTGDNAAGESTPESLATPKQEANTPGQTADNAAGKSTPESLVTPKQPDTKSPIKVYGIYKLHIIGEAPETVAFRAPGFHKILPQIGIITDFKTETSNGSLLTAVEYSLGGIYGCYLEDISMIDPRLIFDDEEIIRKRREGDAYYDINRMVVLYLSPGGPTASDKIVAYSKLTDVTNRKNNIEKILLTDENFYPDENIYTKDDIIAAIVTVIKVGDQYILASTLVNFIPVNGLPEEMKKAAINPPLSRDDAVPISAVFVAYLSFTDIDDKGKPVDKRMLYPDINGRVYTYEVKLITYSPMTGGEPVDMDKQF